jgi:AGZA family xanthine/uracil permease-like MFS transporter
MRRWISALFDIQASGSTIKTEILAGLTTFLTMAYIIFVNPGIQKAAGMPFGAVMTATCLSAAAGSILMGLYANLPIGLAPGMGTNAYFAFYVCGVLGLSWETALGAVFISGVGFLILSVTRLREKIIDAIPDSMKHAIAAGIGILIAFVGLKEAGVIVKNDVVFVGMGDMSSPRVAVTMAGLVITSFLLAKRVKGALIFGILITTAIAMAAGVANVPTEIVSLPPSIAPTFAKMNLTAAMGLGLLHIVFTFLFVDLFDTVATLIGVADQGGLLKKDADGRLKLPRAGRALITDSVATMLGAAFGVSTTVSYIESASGIAVGGRTGLVAVVVGILFLIAPFFAPIVAIVPPEATAPALVIVCVFMLKNLSNIEWGDYTESIPAVIACLAIPLTFSISNGLALGFLLYPAIKIATGRWREANWMVYLLGALFLLKFIFIKA